MRVVSKINLKHGTVLNDFPPLGMFRHDVTYYEVKFDDGSVLRDRASNFSSEEDFTEPAKQDIYGENLTAVEKLEIKEELSTPVIQKKKKK